jgi:acyl carrier protein phosphodiesterase
LPLAADNLNFLAHFHLAWPDDGLIAGGLEGDYFKGPLNGQLPDGIERGVQLHRAIDGFTDRHPAVEKVRGEFQGGLRRYAGILIDLSFDHFLSRHWAKFADLDLLDFNSGIYRSLDLQRGLLSPGAQRMQARLAEHDLLGIYQQWETVSASAERIGTRFRRENPFTDIDEELERRRGRLEEAFLDFYPDLVRFAKLQRDKLN